MAEHTSPTARGPRGSGTKNASAKSPTEKTPKTPKTPVARKKPRPAEVVAVIDPEHRRALIARAAYFRAEQRHFAPGYEAEDWLSAESEVDTELTMGVATSDN